MDVFSEEIIDKKCNRISTGIQKLDELLRGGLPNNSITLVSGTPGSGKTILCFNYIFEGLKKGENCIYFTSDERIDNIYKQAIEIGFDFRHWVNEGKLKFVYLDIDNQLVHKEMDESIKNGNFSRVVLDSLTPVSEIPVWISGVQEINPLEDTTKMDKYSSGSLSSKRLHIRRIMSILNQKNCTAIVTSEVPEGSRALSRDSISEFLVDGVILMDLDMTMDRRKLTIRKMRGTNHTLKPHDISITEGGIRFL
jgi:circadian clock protein KaiC